MPELELLEEFRVECPAVSSEVFRASSTRPLHRQERHRRRRHRRHRHPHQRNVRTRFALVEMYRLATCYITQIRHTRRLQEPHVLKVW